MVPIYVFNVAMEIISMATGCVLFLCCLIDVQKSGSNLKYFIYMLNVGLLSLFAEAGHMVYSSAGHEYPALSESGKEYVLRVERNMPPLATMEGLKYKTKELDLKHGDTLFIYTDGVAEATNSDGELFGTDRMLDALNADPSDKLENLDKTVRAGIDEFVADAPQFDDITILTFRYTG